MSIIFLGSEFDRRAWEIADSLKKRCPGMRMVRAEDANGLLCIKDNDVIVRVARGIDGPAALRAEDLRGSGMPGLHDMDIGSFLLTLEKMGRASGVKVILVPEQADDSVMDSVGSLLPKEEV